MSTGKRRAGGGREGALVERGHRSWKGGVAAAPGELERKVMVEALIWEKVVVE